MSVDRESTPGSAADGGAAGRGWRRWLEEVRDQRTAYLLLLPSVCVFGALVLIPLTTTVLGAFSSSDAVGRITRVGTLANFQGLWEDPRLLRILAQTGLFTFGTVAVTVIISFPLSLVLNQKFRGASAARALLLLPWAAPLAISSMTWRWIFHDQLGALNHLIRLTGVTETNLVWLSKASLAFGCVMFVEVWASVPFMTITFLAGLQAIPPHIYDAAKMDGATPWREFWDMTVPQMRTVFMIVTLLSVIWAFRSFVVIWTLTQGNPFFRTDISVTYLYKLAFRMMSFGEGYALAFLTFIVLLVFSVVYTRMLRSRELE